MSTPNEIDWFEVFDALSKGLGIPLPLDGPSAVAQSMALLAASRQYEEGASFEDALSVGHRVLLDAEAAMVANTGFVAVRDGQVYVVTPENHLDVMFGGVS